MADPTALALTPRPMRTLGAALELVRPGNVAMAGAGAVVGALVATEGLWTWTVAWAVAAVMAVTAGGNALNDLTDARIDRGAHPERPLPSGRISPGLVATLSLGAFAAALALAWPAGWPVVALVLAAEALLVLYELRLKGRGLVGNVAVAALVAATFPTGALAAGGLTAPVAFLSASALLANVAREAWKDIEDARHDEGRRTLAHTWGPDRARHLAQAATVLAVLVSPWPLFWGFGGWVFALLVALAAVGFVAALVQVHPGRAQRLSKLAMLTALVAFTAGAYQ